MKKGEIVIGEEYALLTHRPKGIEQAFPGSSIVLCARVVAADVKYKIEMGVRGHSNMVEKTGFRVELIEDERALGDSRALRSSPFPWPHRDIVKNAGFVYSTWAEWVAADDQGRARMRGIPL